MKLYIKDGIIKTRNQIVIKGQRTIKDKDGNDKVVTTNTYNPTEEMIFADGWEEYVIPTYEPTVEDLARQEAADLAEEARGFLTDTDYKIIKCMESFLCGEVLPYDIAELHRERNEKRQIINEAEKQ